MFKKNSKEPRVIKVAEDKNIYLEKLYKSRVNYRLRHDVFEVNRTRVSKQKDFQKNIPINVQTGFF